MSPAVAAAYLRAYAATRERLCAGDPPMDSLAALTQWRARRSPDAVMSCDERDRATTFAEYAAACERVAAGLADLGVDRTSPVAWMLPTWPEAFVLAGALSRLGVVQVPLLPNWRERELGFILEKTGVSHLVIPGTWRGFDYPALVETVSAARGLAVRAVVADRDLPEGDPAPLPPAPRPAVDETRWIFFTSGTTTVPKGVLHSDATVGSATLEVCVRFDVSPDDANPLLFPVTHVGGIMWLMGALLTGCRQLLVEAFSTAACRDLGRRGVTLASGGPAFWAAFAEAQRDAPGETVYPRLRAVVGGGAPKPAVIDALVRDTLGVVLAPGYGMTECPAVAQSGIFDPEEVRRCDGRPLDGTELRIVRPDGATAAPGEVGEIWVRGPMSCLGYLDPTDDVGAFDEDGFHHSGDLGSLDEHGALRVVGRLKDLIIRKGENISAKEVEDVLSVHPAVADVAVVGLPDDERGERCCAVVVLSPPATGLDLDEIARHCARHGLARYKTPEQLVVAESLPYNETGKVVKRLLVEQLAGGRPQRRAPL